ncbi:uncharacterized protein TDEL_0F01170 [Torulaspora delbrueckii]|uniref:C2H2-type domain-containing protein n=1 Tax=Torulaspora delbrueckii TaxID=4950 RepID=G8ZWD4_TORDE|nr:hypothetical protein TDEL_0F01170 [Torulaspora delbrueckii]CCE92928.1 hypothetical protein TDEL_0F01170 [Torulaspora delbrueckii]
MLTSNSAVYNVSYVQGRLQTVQPMRNTVGTRPRDSHVTLPPISSLVPPSSYPAGMPLAGPPPRMVVAPQMATATRVMPTHVQVAPGPVQGPVLNQAVRLRKQCPVCGKVCSRPSTLKTHYLIHTGDTPFKCSWGNCTKSFNVKSNMLRHLKSHERKLKRDPR